MFEWLSTKRSEQFGIELARILIETAPNLATLNEAKRASKSNYAKEKMKKRLQQFKQSEVLNFFKTAKLLNAFKWELKDAGFDKTLIDEFGSWVFVGLRSQNF